MRPAVGRRPSRFPETLIGNTCRNELASLGNQGSRCLLLSMGVDPQFRGLGRIWEIVNS